MVIYFRHTFKHKCGFALTGIAQLESSPLMNWILTVMFLAEVNRLVRFNLRGYTYNRFL